MTDLRVIAGDAELTAEWTDENPATRAAIEAALPMGRNATRWGDELYFGSNVDIPAENAREEVEPGALAYWPQGNAICLFWGPTPASTGDEPRAASPVNVFAHADVSDFRPGEGGMALRIEAAGR
jgi:hypothetical protein